MTASPIADTIHFIPSLLADPVDPVDWGDEQRRKAEEVGSKIKEAEAAK